MKISKEFREVFTYNYKSENVLAEHLIAKRNGLKLLTAIPIIGSIFSVIILFEHLGGQEENEYLSTLIVIRCIVGVFPVLGTFTLLSVDSIGTWVKLIVDARNSKGTS